jgi:hypothetical protein
MRSPWSRRVLEPSEHDEQALYFRWAGFVTFDGKPLRPRCYAVANGGDRHPVVAAKLKAEGVTPGRPDINVDVSSGGFHGLRIEAKRRGGRPTPEQLECLAMLREDGYRALVGYGFDELRSITTEYLKLQFRVVDRWRA